MFVLKRLIKKINKTLKGGAFIAVEQPRAEWEEQYKKGKWERLVSIQQPNTQALAREIDLLTREVSRDLRIVDLGCGNGALPRMLLKNGVTNIKYVGVDISQTALDTAKTIFPDGTYLQKDLSRDILPEDVKDSDIVVCSEFIYYLPTNKFLSTLANNISADTLVFFSFNKTWRAFFLSLFIRLHFTNIKEVPYTPSPESNVRWVINSAQSKHAKK